MKKLSKLSENLYKMFLTSAEKADFKVLDTYMEGFFPSIDGVSKRIHSLRNNNIDNVQALHPQKDEGYNVFNMFFRSRDDEYMAKYLQEYVLNNEIVNGFFEYQKNHENKNFSLTSAKKYVKLSPLFKAKRDELEQNITKCYIANWINYVHSNDFFCTREQKMIMSQNVRFDELFRENVTGAMKFLNLPKKNIEAGLEATAEFWMEDAMKLAFKNHFKQQFNCEYNFETKDKKLKEYEEKWLALRQKSYYDKHKKSVLKYGKPTEAMKMSNQKTLEVCRWVDCWERCHEMELHNIDPYDYEVACQNH